MQPLFFYTYTPRFKKKFCLSLHIKYSNNARFTYVSSESSS